MSFVYHEPDEYAFRDVNGHHGKKYELPSRQFEPLIIECEDMMTVRLCEHESERIYYIIEGSGYFIVADERQVVAKGDLVFIATGSDFTFGGTLKMLLVDAPRWSPEQEEVQERTDV